MVSPWLPIHHPIPTPKANVGEYTIFKAPPRLQNAYPRMFQAKTLHLGLQNRTLEDLDSVVQDLKVRVADALHKKLTSYTTLLAIQSWNDFAKAVTHPKVSEFQEKYQECTQGMLDDDVLYHLALDALFLVFYFQFLNDKKFTIDEFKILAESQEPTLRSIEVSDFLLLENQIPLVLLKRVMTELCTITSSPGPLVMSDVEDELKKILQQAVVTLIQFSEPAPSSSLFYRLRQWVSREEATNDEYFKKYLEKMYSETKLEHHDHILDCVYHVVCGHIELPQYICEPWQLKCKYLESIPSATQLQTLGIKVKQSSESWNLTTSFKLESHGLQNSHLRLPRVTIYEDTGKEFRNLAVYEQLRGDHNIKKFCGDFRSYLQIMDQLCRTSEDWQLLSHEGVIDLQAGNQEVFDKWTARIKELCSRFQRPPVGWTDCYDDIHKHCRSQWGPWRRKNIGVFFGENGWKWLSVLAALILLVMTGFQTYFTVVNSSTRKPIWPRSIDPQS